MKRSGIARKTPLRRQKAEGQDIAREPKPKAAKERQCAAPNCEATFVQRRMEHIVCSPRCLIAKRAADAKAERESDKARKEKLKAVSEWEDECRRIVQAIARIRDRHDGCISCHLPATWGGQWHGSHYRSHGACSSLQFHLWNIHKACSSCNRDKGGNIIEYRPRLIAKIGQDRHDWLMSQPKQGWKHGPAYIAYLKRFKKVMGKRLRRMEKRANA
jgi:hypothetical protein